MTKHIKINKKVNYNTDPKVGLCESFGFNKDEFETYAFEKTLDLSRDGTTISHIFDLIDEGKIEELLVFATMGLTVIGLKKALSMSPSESAIYQPTLENTLKEEIKRRLHE